MAMVHDTLANPNQEPRQAAGAKPRGPAPGGGRP
jgi:hypothetical protein